MGMLLRLAALGGNVPAPIHVASANGFGATSCTMTIPASTESGDLLIAYSISRATSSLSITDDDTGTPAWTLLATGTPSAGGTIKLWTNTASSTSASKTITISSALDSCVAGLLVIRQATTATVLSNTDLSSGTQSVTGVTVASNALFVLAVATRTTGSFTNQQTASFASLTERVDQQSASGSGSALTLATAQISGATGTVSWTCSNSAASNAMLVQIT